MHARLARLARLLTATTLALAALAAVAGSAHATCGSKLCLDMTRSPSDATSTFVTRNGVVTYDVTVSSVETSTATKVTLQLDLPADTQVLASRTARGCSPPDSDDVITCDLGSVKPSDGLLRFSFDVKMLEAANDAETTASLSSDARDNDTGNVGSDPTPEAFPVTDTVDVNVLEHRAVSAVPPGLPLTLDTDPDGSGPTGSDKRTAVFRLLALGFSTTAVINDEVEDPSFVCPERLRCPTGGWTDASIPGPLGIADPFAFPSIFEVELHYDAETVPKGLTEKSYVMLHLTNTGVLEQISRPCRSNPAPCLKDVDLQRDGDLVATALGTGNFRYR